MYDLQATGFQAGLTRVSTFMYMREGSPQAYPEIGINEGHHGLSHHQDNPNQLAKYARLGTYQAELFAWFLDKMQSTPDGDGSLLDHSLFLYGSNMSNSDRHNNYPLPNFLIGGANGRLKGGQFVNLKERTPQANLLLTVLNKAGIEDKSFADSTGAISEV